MTLASAAESLDWRDMSTDRSGLVAAAAAGDRAAWDAIVTEYAGLVWAVARSFRLSAADAADVSQVTWLRLLENLDRIRDPAALGAWLATTARREAVNVLRQRRELPAPDHTDVADDREPPPWQAVLVGERDRELWQAFRRLPDRCQRLLRLLVLEPEPGGYAAAAAALDVPVGSLGPTRARCLAALRGHLAERAEVVE
jgi:RNA polymerase sigma factor (sigma-70 family)